MSPLFTETKQALVSLLSAGTADCVARLQGLDAAQAETAQGLRASASAVLTGADWYVYLISQPCVRCCFVFVFILVLNVEHLLTMSTLLSVTFNTRLRCPSLILFIV